MMVQGRHAGTILSQPEPQGRRLVNDEREPINRPIGVARATPQMTAL